MEKESFFLLLLLFFLFRAAPATYGSSQAGVELELQLSAYTTAPERWNPSHACDLHHNSQQRQILNPLSEARDQTPNLTVPSWIRFCCAMMGTPEHYIFKC